MFKNKKKVIFPLLVTFSLGLSLNSNFVGMANNIDNTAKIATTNINSTFNLGKVLNAATNITQKQGPGTVDWANNFIRVTGTGAPPDGNNQSQRRLMAIRAAKVDAYRQLAEVIYGVNVNSETIVKDFITESDVIKTQVAGLVKGAETVGEPRYLSDGSVEVDVQVRIFGAQSVASIIKPQEHRVETPPTQVKPEPVSEMYTSVIFDCKGLGVEPAMSPAVLDEDGGEVYVGNIPIDPDYVINEGIVSYEVTIADAKNNSRAGEKPLIIKGKKVKGIIKSDVYISKDDAKKLLGANEKGQFLTNFKVIMVI